MGPGTTGLIGLRVPGTGNLTNGIRQQGQGISKSNFNYPFLELAPRVGVAYLLRPDGKLIARGEFGIFYDRTEGNYTMSQSGNPPTAESTTLYYSQLQTLGQGAASGSVPTLVIYRYENDHLPTATTWNAGVQTELPYSFALDVRTSGSGCRTRMPRRAPRSEHLNMVDLGTAYLPQLPGPDAQQHDAGRRGLHPEPAAAVPGLREHQPVRSGLLSPEPQPAVLAAAPVQPRLLGRPELERGADGRGHPLPRLRRAAAHRAPGRRVGGPAGRPEDNEMIRPRPPPPTSSRATWFGICRTCMRRARP